MPVGSGSLPATTIGELALAAARQGGQRPFVTFYDDATGERTELGHATLHNWVSKTANLLVEELEIHPPADLDIRVGTHWTTLVVLLAAWRSGLRARLGGVGGQGGPAALTVLGEGDAETISDPERTLIVGSGLGGRLAGDAGGALAFADDVLRCADEFDDPALLTEAPALVLGTDQARGTRTALTHAGLLALAQATAGALGLGHGDRVLVGYPLDSLEGIGLVVASLAAGASIVLVAGGTPGGAQPRAVAERCDLVLDPLAVGRGHGDTPANDTTAGGVRTDGVPERGLRVEVDAGGSVTGVQVLIPGGVGGR